MKTSPQKLTLPEVLHLIRERCGSAPTYSFLWRAIAEGRIPATKHGTRWMVDRDAIPAALEMLGLEPLAPEARPAAVQA